MDKKVKPSSWNKLLRDLAEFGKSLEQNKREIVINPPTEKPRKGKLSELQR
jgi:hypothetical protein